MAESLRDALPIWRSIFRRWPRLPQRFFGISGVCLSQTRIMMLLCLSLRPHNHLGSL